ncbi:hypothetical protein VP01_1175g4 [Puccinia sorghi]|uniref:BZIP domain-containing protein n=1 Tax=Puccinia sorghi TaxID=27349 RepID=A0A0L6VRD2_9BASI|nr:hypothetical protein VP01_1175g4 [Puccinia sorghi]
MTCDLTHADQQQPSLIHAVAHLISSSIILPSAGSASPSSPQAEINPMPSDHSISFTKNSSRPSSRSLAPLLNHLTPPPSLLSSQLPPCHSHPNTKTNHHHPQESITSSLDSSSAASESPPTPSSHHFLSISPSSSYHPYRPDSTSLSSPIFPFSSDHPDFYSPPPFKRQCQFHKSEPPPSPPIEQNEQLHPTLALQQPATNPSRIIKSCIYHPVNLLSRSSSTCSREADESNQPSPPDHHPPASHTYSHLSAIPHSMLGDEDRSLYTRPLKNTKRAAQNRAAQRAFRERKDRYVRELEARSAQFEEYLVRYGLLEHREHQIAAREAELMNKRPQAGTIDEGRSMNRRPTTPSDEERLNHIDHLEQQLESSQQEIARLRVELLKFHREEEANQKRSSKVLDTLQRSNGELPRPVHVSEAEEGARTPCSSGSPLALRFAAKTSTAPQYQRSPWSREFSGDNRGPTEPIERDKMYFFAERKPVNQSPNISITTERQKNAANLHQKDWSNEDSDGCGSTHTGLAVPHHYQRHNCAHAEVASNLTEQQPPSISQCASKNGVNALSRLRKLITQDGHDQVVRLPAIQSHPKHMWCDENTPQLGVMKLTRGFQSPRGTHESKVYHSFSVQ